MPEEKVYYNRIKAVAADNHATNEMIAEYCHVSPNTVAKWNANIQQPSWEKLHLIVKFFNCDVRELIVSTEVKLGPSPCELALKIIATQKAAVKGKSKKHPKK